MNKERDDNLHDEVVHSDEHSSFDDIEDQMSFAEGMMVVMFESAV